MDLQYYGGGRYDTLSEIIGGPKTPAIGFSFGIERIMNMIKEDDELLSKINKEGNNIYIVTIPAEKDDSESDLKKLNRKINKYAMEIAKIFRENSYKTMLNINSRSFNAQMKHANKIKANYVIIIGSEEFNNRKLNIKNMNSGKQLELQFNDIESSNNLNNIMIELNK